MAFSPLFQCLQGASTSEHVSEFPSTLWLSNAPFVCIYSTFWLSIFLLVDTCVASTCWNLIVNNAARHGEVFKSPECSSAVWLCRSFSSLDWTATLPLGDPHGPAQHKKCLLDGLALAFCTGWRISFLKCEGASADCCWAHPTLYLLKPLRVELCYFKVLPA